MEETKGVSGKSETESWVRGKELDAQKNHAEETREIGDTDNLYGRMDLSDQNPTAESKKSASVSLRQVEEALAISPEIDAQGIQFKIDGSTITLEGKVKDLKEARAVIGVLENLRGVTKVRNKLELEDTQSKISH